MQYDYINILHNNGFKIPPKKDYYSEQEMIMNCDYRHEELPLIIHDFFYGYYPLPGALQYIDANGRLFTLKVDKQGFIMMDNETGEWVFSVTENPNGDFVCTIRSVTDIVMIRQVVVAAPRATESADALRVKITGYDQDVVRAFKESKQTTASFTDFVASQGIIPDLSREITIGVSSFSSVMIQEKHVNGTSQTNIFDTSIRAAHARSLYPYLMSYIRARDYAGELRTLKGLPFNLEENMRLVLKRKLTDEYKKE